MTGANLPFRLSAARPLYRATLALALTVTGSITSAQVAPTPAAQCAAIWYGYADYAELSAHLSANPADTEMAKAFRDVAVGLDGDAARVDGYIADQRPQMVRLVDSYIFGGDQQSRDLFERLTTRCHDVAGRHPETRTVK